MFEKMIKFFAVFVLGFLWLAVLLLAYFNFPVKKTNNPIELGITFSSRYSQDIGLNWKENYVALLDDLRVKKIRIPIYWDLVEKEKDVYDFSDIDWQLDEAEKRNAEIILVVGQKVPRWPECFIPKWIGVNNEELRKNELLKNEEILQFIKDAVVRHKEHPAIKYWQVENEPFLAFGDCPTPTINANILDREIEIIRRLDPDKKIIITDSGELSTWMSAAARADIFGTTMYRNIYRQGWGYYVYPLGPRFFQFKRWIIDRFVGQKNAIVIELQGEPWVSGWTVHRSLEEQFASMNERKLRQIVEYAGDGGFSEVYLWGAEWWYWLKEKQDHPEVWEEARSLINM
ncbi:MAG: hypothetical protein US66_C0001G0066 [Candidatus Moranbacteria bacterium GW2011_GWD2_37_9]|nr:MAG: hypothetical protein US66_C0001G0066 [Candidatus Moranbacteria bacterium GW2011_GWD2_37_9]